MANQEKARPGAAAAAGTRPFPWCFGVPTVETAGDWTCPQCNDLQFARNAVCRRCGDGGEMVEIYWSERVHFHLGKGFLEWYCFGVVALNSLNQLSMSHWTEPGHLKWFFGTGVAVPSPPWKLWGSGCPESYVELQLGPGGWFVALKKLCDVKGPIFSHFSITSMGLAYWPTFGWFLWFSCR